MPFCIYRIARETSSDMIEHPAVSHFGKGDIYILLNSTVSGCNGIVKQEVQISRHHKLGCPVITAHFGIKGPVPSSDYAI